MRMIVLVAAAGAAALMAGCLVSEPPLRKAPEVTARETAVAAVVAEATAVAAIAAAQEATAAAQVAPAVAARETTVAAEATAVAAEAIAAGKQTILVVTDVILTDDSEHISHVIMSLGGWGFLPPVSIYSVCAREIQIGKPLPASCKTVPGTPPAKAR